MRSKAVLTPGNARHISESLTLLLAPFAPYTAQDLWSELGHSGPVFRHSWPKFDADLAKEDLIEIPVQVNGKLRGHLKVALATAKDELVRLAKDLERVKPFLEGKQGGESCGGSRSVGELCGSVRTHIRKVESCRILECRQP